MILKNGKNIYLIGFMGSGKSTVGKVLAEELNYEFVDTDEEIEKETGMKIKDIFKEYGEEYFRDLERKKILELSKKRNLVISTGGGLPAKEENLNVMKNSGIVIWLKIDFDTFLNRVGNDENRPLLKEDINKLKERFNNRKKYYSQADIVVINDDTKTVDETVREILEKIKERKN